MEVGDLPPPQRFSELLPALGAEDGVLRDHLPALGAGIRFLAHVHLPVDVGDDVLHAVELRAALGTDLCVPRHLRTACGALEEVVLLPPHLLGTVDVCAALPALDLSREDQCAALVASPVSLGVQASVVLHLLPLAADGPSEERREHEDQEEYEQDVEHDDGGPGVALRTASGPGEPGEGGDGGGIPVIHHVAVPVGLSDRQDQVVQLGHVEVRSRQRVLQMAARDVGAVQRYVLETLYLRRAVERHQGDLRIAQVDRVPVVSGHVEVRIHGYRLRGVVVHIADVAEGPVVRDRLPAVVIHEGRPHHGPAHHYGHDCEYQGEPCLRLRFDTEEVRYHVYDHGDDEPAYGGTSESSYAEDGDADDGGGAHRDDLHHCNGAEDRLGEDGTARVVGIHGVRYLIAF